MKKATFILEADEEEIKMKIEGNSIEIAALLAMAMERNDDIYRLIIAALGARNNVITKFQHKN